VFGAMTVAAIITIISNLLLLPRASHPAPSSSP